MNAIRSGNTSEYGCTCENGLSNSVARIEMFVRLMPWELWLMLWHFAGTYSRSWYIVMNLIMWFCKMESTMFWSVNLMASPRLFCIPMCIYSSQYCLTAMAPNCSSWGKYNYNSKMLTSDSQCLHCGNMYKSQGIKWHESTCKMRNAEGQEAFVQEFKRGQQSALGESFKSSIA